MESIAETLKSASSNEIDLLTRLMQSSEMSGYLNNKNDLSCAKSLASKGLIEVISNGKTKAQVTARFMPEDRQLLKDLLKINKESNKTNKNQLFGELQLSAAMDEVVDLVGWIAPGITFRYFALSPETIELVTKERKLLGAHPGEAQNVVAADGLYFGIKKREIGEPESTYDTQIRSVLGAKKPGYEFTEDEITFKAAYDVPVHIKLISEDDPIIQYLNYPNQEFWGDDIIFTPNPLKDYLAEL